MKQLFLKKLKNLNCLESTKFLLAISGGVDSMVLLDLFSKTNFKYAIAHCNFGLRDNESDIDAVHYRIHSLDFPGEALPLGQMFNIFV